jgi:hypothetical protein
LPKAGAVPPAEYWEIHSAVKAARAKAQAARAALMDHLRDHGCKTELNGFHFDLQ